MLLFLLPLLGGERTCGGLLYKSIRLSLQIFGKLRYPRLVIVPQLFGQPACPASVLARYAGLLKRVLHGTNSTIAPLSQTTVSEAPRGCCPNLDTSRCGLGAKLLLIVSN